MYVTEIWQLTYAIWQGIGKGPSIWQGMEKDQTYTWYMCMSTKYSLGLPLNISYTSVYDIIYQVYYRIQEYMTAYTRFTVVLKRLCRYILMTCKYILVYTLPEHCYVHCNVTVPWTLLFPVNCHHIPWTPIIIPRNSHHIPYRPYIYQVWPCIYSHIPS